MTHRVLVVADDLTGAMDTGHEFAARGASTVVALDGDENGEKGIGERGASDVLVVDTDSRAVEPLNAARAVREAIATHPARIVYKKIDSTLRGNVVPEIDAAIESSSAELVIVAPAFPATGRTTVAGTHRVDGTPVTEMLEGNQAPTTAHLPTLLEGSSYPVATCSLARVCRGVEAIDERVSRIDEPTIVVADVREANHLDAIARAVATDERNVLYVGSAGLARHVRLSDDRTTDTQGLRDEPTVGEPADDEPTSDPGSRESTRRESAYGELASRETPAGGSADGMSDSERTAERVLGVAGSVHPRTVEQVGALPDELVVALDAARAVTDPDAAAVDASTRAVEALIANGRAVVTSVPDDEAIERVRNAGAAAGRQEDIGKLIERALGAVAEQVYDEHAPDGLVLTGGAVAVATLRALDATAIRFTGAAVERGVPVGRVIAGQAAGTRVITKAGGFGDERTIANCLAHLGGRNERRGA